MSYTTLMAGDGTNDVNGTPEDLKKIAEHQKNERIKEVYESQLSISSRFAAQRVAADQLKEKRKKNPMGKFDLASITDKMAELGDEDEPPQIKLGDASCAALFTSKLSNVSAITSIIRQGRCTLVASLQMYKILALNCLITAYSLSVQYLDSIKFGDYQVTVSESLMSLTNVLFVRGLGLGELEAPVAVVRVSARAG
ncbi:hypothetical protein M422DRAFT_270018 [Sphaerobolus stellatus SS14]|uniref:Uncharacterized protein n=1 Tax=Sphaerobolus stellatus (strain SS14) TaxID=990650 RepID=A0A0C9UU32_SPHS4|nr:hypothetical protein M422DRAFT_270018 [Sphaerobolus stellatus SS14]